MAVIEIQDGRYVLGIWFVGDGHSEDWLACVSRDEDGTWQLRYRFRYYNSGDPFDGKDEKNEYSAQVAASATEDDLLKAVRTVAKVTSLKCAMQSRTGKPLYSELLVRTSNADTILAALMKESWCHLGEQTLFGQTAAKTA